MDFNFINIALEEEPTEFDKVENVCPECHMVKPKNGECC